MTIAEKCPLCSCPVGEFRDEVSRREYAITGVCQVCQDDVFAEPEPGEDDEVCPHCGSGACYIASGADGFVLRCGNTGKAIAPAPPAEE